MVKSRPFEEESENYRIRELISYLGKYAVKITDEENAKFLSLFNNKDNFLIYCDRETSLKLGCLFLCTWEHTKNHRSVLVQEMVSGMLSPNKGESSASVYKSIGYDTLFLHYSKHTPYTKLNEEYPLSIAESRHFSGLRTIMFSEVALELTADSGLYKVVTDYTPANTPTLQYWNKDITLVQKTIKIRKTDDKTDGKKNKGNGSDSGNKAGF